MKQDFYSNSSSIPTHPWLVHCVVHAYLQLVYSKPSTIFAIDWQQLSYPQSIVMYNAFTSTAALPVIKNNQQQNVTKQVRHHALVLPKQELHPHFRITEQNILFNYFIGLFRCCKMYDTRRGLLYIILEILGVLSLELLVVLSCSRE